MRKIKNKELYSQITRGSVLGTLLSIGGFAVSSQLLDISQLPLITSTVCLTASVVTSYISSCIEAKNFVEENIGIYPKINSIKMLKEMKYHLKEAKKNIINDKNYFTDAQLKSLNYTLDDDLVGLKEYINSTEFCEDLKQDYGLQDQEEIEIPQGSNVIRFEKRR